MLKRFLTAFQEDSKTSGGTETCHTYPTEGLGHLAHATTSGVLLRVVKTCEVEFCSSRIQVGSWYHILIILLTLQYTFQRKHPRLTPFLWNQNQLTPPIFQLGAQCFTEVLRADWISNRLRQLKLPRRATVWSTWQFRFIKDVKVLKSESLSFLEQHWWGHWRQSSMQCRSSPRSLGHKWLVDDFEPKV